LTKDNHNHLTTMGFHSQAWRKRNVLVYDSSYDGTFEGGRWARECVQLFHGGWLTYPDMQAATAQGRPNAMRQRAYSSKVEVLHSFKGQSYCLAFTSAPNVPKLVFAFETEKAMNEALIREVDYQQGLMEMMNPQYERSTDTYNNSLSSGLTTPRSNKTTPVMRPVEPSLDRIDNVKQEKEKPVAESKDTQTDAVESEPIVKEVVKEVIKEEDDEKQYVNKADIENLKKLSDEVSKCIAAILKTPPVMPTPALPIATPKTPAEITTTPNTTNSTAATKGTRLASTTTAAAAAGAPQEGPAAAAAASSTTTTTTTTTGGQGVKRGPSQLEGGLGMWLFGSGHK